MEECPCGSGNLYDECCGQYISGAAAAPTAEALMRSRYSAYVKAEIDYLQETLSPRTRKDFDRASAERWARSSQWQGLEIVNVVDGKENDNKGTVEFIATFSEDGEMHKHHETARFQKQDGNWYFVEGRMASATIRRQGPKIGRNDPCPCGSGKKYKKCCGRS